MSFLNVFSQYSGCHQLRFVFQSEESISLRLFSSYAIVNSGTCATGNKGVVVKSQVVLELID